jgi:hypothetical protein
MDTRKTSLSILVLAALGVAVTGCAPKPTVMAPPVSQPAPPPMPAANAGTGQAYQWQDVPANQEVPITRGVFDQGGYQLYAQSGETIVVPFANQNMYVMKFGKSNSGFMYFVNDNGQVPTLYVPSGGFLENAAAQGAKWYPFSNDFNYTRPVYMGIAPTWSAYTSMGWYPGMAYYGGYWGYNPWSPGIAFTPMVGLYFNIGGTRYGSWNSYTNYYRYNRAGAVGWNSYRGYNYSTVGRRANSTGSFGRGAGSTGSFGSGRSTAGSFGRSAGGSGSFGTGRTSGSGSFGRSAGSSGSFGSGRTSASAPGPGGSSFGRSSGSGSFGSGGSSFGTARNTPGGGSSFGSGSSGRSSFGGGSSSFGSGSSGSRSSFGSGSSGFGSSGRSSFGGGSSFGGSSSGSSSFGRSSGGSSSFGSSSGRSSFGGGRSSFGGGRRR